MARFAIAVAVKCQKRYERNKKNYNPLGYSREVHQSSGCSAADCENRMFLKLSPVYDDHCVTRHNSGVARTAGQSRFAPTYTRVHNSILKFLKRIFYLKYCKVLGCNDRVAFRNCASFRQEEGLKSLCGIFQHSKDEVILEYCAKAFHSLLFSLRYKHFLTIFLFLYNFLKVILHYFAENVIINKIFSNQRHCL